MRESFFIPPFEVKEKHGMISVVNGNDIAIGIYGNHEQADKRAAELNAKYPTIQPPDKAQPAKTEEKCFLNNPLYQEKK